MFENIAFAHGILSIGCKENTTTSSRSGNLIASLKEAPAIIRTITVQQAPAEPEPAASRPLKLHLMVTDDEGAPLAADEVTASYILPSGDSKLERWADTGGRRTGTISMQWVNIEASEITAYDVEVSQEP